MNRRRTLAAVAFLIASSALVGLWATYERGNWRFVSPDPQRHPVWGVDVSRHQGDIAWRRVAAHPRIAFAYVKATEGGDWTDPSFARNWSEARRAGLAVGAYHFFTFCRPAADQARHFLAVVPPTPDELPPALDVEFGGNCARRPSLEEVREGVATWMRLVETARGQRPVLYVTPEAFDAFLAGAPVREALWYRNLLREPGLPDGQSWRFWQFANRARVDGIEGPVDLNAFSGPRAALTSL